MHLDASNKDDQGYFELELFIGSNLNLEHIKGIKANNRS